MRILLTNDDGWFAKGICTLAQVLERDHEVYMCAPDVQRSAQSHAITILKPMKVKKETADGVQSPIYSVAGTPADSVRVGLELFGKEEPIDLVISGINHGLNDGMDVLYSGTVSAAIEANIYGLPSIAASYDSVEGDNFLACAEKIRTFIQDNEENLLNHKILINLNFPATMEETQLFVPATIGDVKLDLFVREEEADGSYSFTAQSRQEIEEREGTDRYYLSQGKPTITPLQYDFTNSVWMDRISDWNA